MHRLQDLVRLHRMGQTTREVARLLGMSPNTERKYREALKAAGLLAGQPQALPSLDVLRSAVEAELKPKLPAQQRSSIERWRKRVEELDKKGLGPQAIRDRLRQEEPSFSGSIGAVKRMVRRLHRERGVQPEDVAIPVVTDPGDVAQVDFGYVGKLMDPRTKQLRRAWVFVMVLGYSRKMWARVVFDQSTETWLQLHVEAFDHLGGVPRTLVPDNLKAAVIRAAFGKDGHDERSLNRSYAELARHYGFIIDPAPPRAPKKKGKVESAVKYVKRNVLAGRHGEDIDLVNAALDRWVREIADRRTHGTTRRIPGEVFAAEEQPQLLALPKRRFEKVRWQRAVLRIDNHVSFAGRLYSAPWRYIGQRLWVRATATTVTVHSETKRLSTHARHGRSHRSTNEEDLPTVRGAYRHRNPEYWVEFAKAIGEQTTKLVQTIFAEQGALSKLPVVQKLLLHLEDHPPERAEAACRRALYYGNHSHGAIKHILLQRLDFEPMPDDKPDICETWATPPRFARDFGSMLTSPGGEA